MIYNMYIISFIITMILIGFIVYNKVKLRKKTKLGEEAIALMKSRLSNLKEVNTTIIPLSSMRHFGYMGLEIPNDDKIIDDKKHIYFIDETANEALGIFLSLGPEVLDILTKAAKLLSEIANEIDSNEISESEVRRKLKLTGDSLKSLSEVSDRLETEIYKICTKSSAHMSQLETKSELVEGFITTAAEMIYFAFDYVNLSNLVSQKLDCHGLQTRREMSEISTAFLQVFFHGLLNCIFMIDTTISVLIEKERKV